MTATTVSDMFDRDAENEETFHKSLIKTIDHNLKGEGLRKRKLQLQDK